MNNTLVLYESNYNTTKKVAEIISFIVGNSKLLDIENSPNSIDKYSNIIIAFPLFGNKTGYKTIRYLEKHNFDFTNKKLIVVCVGISKKDGIQYSTQIQNITKKANIYYHFIHGELVLSKLTEEDKSSMKKFSEIINVPFKDMGEFKETEAVKAAINIKKYIDRPQKTVPKIEMKKSIDQFIKKHTTATIATGYESFIRATPIEYEYKDDVFYFISEGGLKYIGILQNKNISMAIYEEYTGMDNLRGLQITGRYQMIDTCSKEYEEIISLKKLNLEYIKKLPITLNIFKVIPIKYEYLNSNFKENGYDARQILDCID